MRFDPFWLPAIQSGPLNRPSDGLAQRLAHDRPTGCADGRQRRVSPRTHTALAQLGDQQTVHQQHEVKVARLPLAAAQLTLSQAD
jgi:hypothetical protein